MVHARVVDDCQAVEHDWNRPPTRSGRPFPILASGFVEALIEGSHGEKRLATHAEVCGDAGLRIADVVLLAQVRHAVENADRILLRAGSRYRAGDDHICLAVLQCLDAAVSHRADAIQSSSMKAMQSPFDSVTPRLRATAGPIPASLIIETPGTGH